MCDLIQQQRLVPQGKVTLGALMPLYLRAIVTGLLLSAVSLIAGCGSGGETGTNPSVSVTPSTGGGASTASATLTWNSVQDPSVTPPVSTYFVHYGRQSSGQPGSCNYEEPPLPVTPDSAADIQVSATISNLDPGTVYYFAVSAYNGQESLCSNEVSTPT